MKTEQELLQVVIHWDDAIARNDLAEMEKYMSDDWVIVGSGSGITTRAAFLDSIINGDLVHTKMSTEETRIKIYDNSAVVTARGVSEGVYKGQTFSFDEWSTSVFILKDGCWICVLTMVTPI